MIIEIYTQKFMRWVWHFKSVFVSYWFITVNRYSCIQFLIHLQVNYVVRPVSVCHWESFLIRLSSKNSPSAEYLSIFSQNIGVCFHKKKLDLRCQLERSKIRLRKQGNPICLTQCILFVRKTSTLFENRNILHHLAKLTTIL